MHPATGYRKQSVVHHGGRGGQSREGLLVMSREYDRVIREYHFSQPGEQVVIFLYFCGTNIFRCVIR